MANEDNLPRVLIVDDELSIQRFLHTALDTGEFSCIRPKTATPPWQRR